MDVKEQVLVIMYAQPDDVEFVTRREIITTLYVCECILEIETVPIVDVFPDGADSELANVVIDILIMKGYVESDRGFLKLTRKGKEYARKILTNPDNRYARVLFRISREVWHLDNKIRMDLVTYLYFKKEYGARLADVSYVKSIITKLRDFSSLFIKTKETQQKIAIKEKVREY